MNSRQDLIRQETLNMPPWMAMMRAAAMKAVNEEDIEAIVRKQVEKAKAGDQQALKFVFDHVLGGQQLKGATFVQNNFHGEGADPNKPTPARPGTKSKLEKMRQRVAAGLPATNDKDGPEVQLD